MDSVLRTSTLPVVCLLVYVAGIHATAACDSPHVDNERPVNVTEEEYAKYCCGPIKNGSSTSTSRFDCASEGGCCGEVDEQYCCDGYKSIIVVGSFLAVVMFCLFTFNVCRSRKSADRGMPSDIRWNSGIRTNYHLGDADGIARPCSFRIPRPSVYRTTQPSASISFHRKPHTDPVCTIAMPPTAPSAYVPDVPPDAPPPSYTEVIRNPHVFPSTENGNAICTV